MKHLFLLILISSFVTAFGQNNPIEKANKLIEDKKYESAILVLNESDPNNESPDIVIAKTDLFLNYFVTSIMHQMFALKDLEQDEELMEIRGTAGNFRMFAFQADSILMRLIEKNPDNFKLNKSLGNYYYEVHLKYQQQWLLEDSMVINKFYNNYMLAYENGEYDYWSTYGMGYAYLMNQDFENALVYLEKSTELNSEYASSFYNLAYAYLYTNQREKGIESAEKAMELYEYPDYKADAARMIAVMYRELERYEEAWEYFILADKIVPNNYYTLKPLLEMAMKLKKDSYREISKQFFLLAPDNPTIYQDLLGIYWGDDIQDELIVFLDSQHDDYLQNNKVNGNLYFYIAKIQLDKEDYENAKINFEKSKEIFRKVFEPDHSVFQVIESIMREI